MNEYKKAAIFSGSQSWIDRAKVAKVFDQLRPDVVIEGGADGLDTIARWECLERKISVITFHADWKRFKLGAGPIRNKQMLQELLKFKKKGYEISVQAFPIQGGKGTQGMIRMAEFYNVPVRVHKPISTQHLMGKRSARK